MLYRHLLCFYAALYFYIINLSRKPQEGDACVDNSPFLNCDSLWRNKKMLHRTLCNISIDHISLYIFNPMDPQQVHSWMLNQWGCSFWYKVFIMLVLMPPFPHRSLLFICKYLQFSSIQSVVSVLATPWTAAHQASLLITNSRSLPKLMSIDLVTPSSHLILCCPLYLLPSIFPSTRVFSN